MARDVDLQAPTCCTTGLAFTVELAASEERADAAHELGDRERLRHVVIGADLEPDDAIGLGVARRQHDDRQVALRAQRPARHPVPCVPGSSRSRIIRSYLVPRAAAMALSPSPTVRPRSPPRRARTRPRPRSQVRLRLRGSSRSRNHPCGGKSNRKARSRFGAVHGELAVHGRDRLRGDRESEAEAVAGRLPDDRRARTAGPDARAGCPGPVSRTSSRYPPFGLSGGHVDPPLAGVLDRVVDEQQRRASCSEVAVARAPRSRLTGDLERHAFRGRASEVSSAAAVPARRTRRAPSLPDCARARRASPGDPPSRAVWRSMCARKRSRSSASPSRPIAAPDRCRDSGQRRPQLMRGVPQEVACHLVVADFLRDVLETASRPALVRTPRRPSPAGAARRAAPTSVAGIGAAIVVSRSASARSRPSAGPSTNGRPMRMRSRPRMLRARGFAKTTFSVAVDPDDGTGEAEEEGVELPRDRAPARRLDLRGTRTCVGTWRHREPDGESRRRARLDPAG